MAYTPTLFTKGSRQIIADSLEQEVQLLWEGWVKGDGLGLVIPRTLLPAHLSDIDDLQAGFDDLEADVSQAQADILLLKDNETWSDTATDDSNATYTLSVGSFTSWASGLLVSVPPTDRMIHISFGVGLTVTGAGPGNVTIAVHEVTTGVAVDRGALGLADEAFSTGTVDKLLSIAGPIRPIKPLAVPAWRHFRLAGGVFRTSGTTLTMDVAGGGTADNRSPWIEASVR